MPYHEHGDQVTHITSLNNAHLKNIIALRRRRKRRESLTTLVEGYEELDLTLRAGVVPNSIYMCPELGGDPADAKRVARRAAQAGSSLFQLSRQAFEKVAYRESPDGWLAIVPEVETALDNIETGRRPLIIVCESVEKPGNLGSILRTCDAAGATAVISLDPVTDWGNPNVIRASKGAVFAVPVASCEPAELLDWLRRHEVTLLATTPDTSTLVTELDLTGPLAILVGSENHGLSQRMLREAQYRAKVPMFGKIDSLNVGVTVAIATYETVRQRTSIHNG